MKAGLLSRIILAVITSAGFFAHWWFSGQSMEGVEIYIIAAVGLIIFLFIGYVDPETSSPSDIEKILRVLRFLGMIPQPTESGLFVMAAGAILVPTIFGLWPDIFEFFSSARDARVFFFTLVAVVGVYLSVLHLFVRRPKAEWEITCMRFFMIVFLLTLSIFTSIYVFSEGKPGYFIFSAWSAIQAFVIYLLGSRHWAPLALKMPLQDSTLKEIVGVIIVTPAVIIGAWHFNQHWTVALSSALLIWSLFEVVIGPKTK